MSTYQTQSGLWVKSNQSLPMATNVPTQPIAQHQEQVLQPAHTNIYDPQTGAAFRWPPKLSKAVWFVAAPMILSVLGVMVFALFFIGAVAKNIIF